MKAGPETSSRAAEPHLSSTALDEEKNGAQLLKHRPGHISQRGTAEGAKQGYLCSADCVHYSRKAESLACATPKAGPCWLQLQLATLSGVSDGRILLYALCQEQGVSPCTAHSSALTIPALTAPLEPAVCVLLGAWSHTLQGILCRTVPAPSKKQTAGFQEAVRAGILRADRVYYAELSLPPSRCVIACRCGDKLIQSTGRQQAFSSTIMPRSFSGMVDKLR